MSFKSNPFLIELISEAFPILAFQHTLFWGTGIPFPKVYKTVDDHSAKIKKVGLLWIVYPLNHIAEKPVLVCIWQGLCRIQQWAYMEKNYQ